jgi:hypothetical protein
MHQIRRRGDGFDPLRRSRLDPVEQDAIDTLVTGQDRRHRRLPQQVGDAADQAARRHQDTPGELRFDQVGRVPQRQLPLEGRQQLGIFHVVELPPWQGQQLKTVPAYQPIDPLGPIDPKAQF